jgi:ABC-2 type transport system ATP-binding protein
MSDSDAAIVTQGLRRSFGPIKAVDGVDLAAPGGTVLGLLGPNGAVRPPSSAS